MTCRFAEARRPGDEDGPREFIDVQSAFARVRAEAAAAAGYARARALAAPSSGVERAA
jgi:hypothetical protein